MKEKLVEFLTNEVLSKNQIGGLPPEYVKKKIILYFLREGSTRKKLEAIELDKLRKNSLVKKVIKEIRSEIGEAYGQYLTQNFNKKEKFLELTDEENLLKAHKSSRERYDYYNEIYKKIFDWYKPKKITDLGCGLNPTSFNIIRRILEYSPEYVACDLNPKDMEFIVKYFNKYSIKGSAFAEDLVEMKFLDNQAIQSSDLVFLFKVIDSLERIKKNITKEILEKLKAKHIAISFPTKSLIAKKEFEVRRNWLFKYLNKKNWECETFEVENEMFILTKKTQEMN